MKVKATNPSHRIEPTRKDEVMLISYGWVSTSVDKRWGSNSKFMKPHLFDLTNPCLLPTLPYTSMNINHAPQVGTWVVISFDSVRRKATRHLSYIVVVVDSSPLPHTVQSLGIAVVGGSRTSRAPSKSTRSPFIRGAGSYWFFDHLPRRDICAFLPMTWHPNINDIQNFVSPPSNSVQRFNRRDNFFAPLYTLYLGAYPQEETLEHNNPWIEELHMHIYSSLELFWFQVKKKKSWTKYQFSHSVKHPLQAANIGTIKYTQRRLPEPAAH